ncbi:MAG: polyprenyl synthetase family protein [Bacteroidetes bacterium]|nr:polyprenyl synthetase family protein [Bacteroidota bacterium]
MPTIRETKASNGTIMMEIREYKSRFENYLESCTWSGKPDSLYEPVRYILQIGGKRIRPVLALMSGDAFGDLNDDHFKLATSIEVFHNFTLLHDDIMDQADKRRGMEAVHKRFGVNSAILSGDLMLIMASQIMHKACKSAGNLDDVMELFLTVGTEVCEGQEYDMRFETLNEVSMHQYEEMVRSKTAVLLGFSLYAGARNSGLEVDRAQRLYEYGVQSGIVFQMWDDYLDVFGRETSGKRHAGDIFNKKGTCLIICLRNQLVGADADLFEKIWSKSSLDRSDVKKIIELMNTYDVDQRIANLAKSKYETARQSIVKSIPEERLRPIFSLTDQFAGRKM